MGHLVLAFSGGLRNRQDLPYVYSYILTQVLWGLFSDLLLSPIRVTESLAPFRFCATFPFHFPTVFSCLSYRGRYAYFAFAGGSSMAWSVFGDYEGAGSGSSFLIWVYIFSSLPYARPQDDHADRHHGSSNSTKAETCVSSGGFAHFDQPQFNGMLSPGCYKLLKLKNRSRSNGIRPVKLLALV